MRALLLAVAVLAAGPVRADTPLPDPSLEARAQALSREIRCVVCENEPISHSSADMAVDMRQVVRDRIAAGDTDQQVRDYFSRRYGEFVLLRPPVDAGTMALWGLPLILLALGVGGILLARRSAPVAVPDEDLAKARAALEAAERDRTAGGA
jgi:cytochrome c-type biogenesis protein CcmH